MSSLGTIAQSMDLSYNKSHIEQIPEIKLHSKIALTFFGWGHCGTVLYV